MPRPALCVRLIAIPRGVLSARSLRVVCCEPTLDEMLNRAPQTAKQFYETMLLTDGFRFAFVESETCSDLIELCNL